MKAAKDRLGCDDAEALNRPVEWGILVWECGDLLPSSELTKCALSLQLQAPAFGAEK
jgi:hypothetical protein